MKNVWKWIALYMMAVVPMSLVSCSDKDDDAPPAKESYTDPVPYAGFFACCSS